MKTAEEYSEIAYAMAENNPRRALVYAQLAVASAILETGREPEPIVTVTRFEEVD